MVRTAENLQTENDKLRESLEQILYLPLHNPSGDSFDWYDDAQYIADNALEQAEVSEALCSDIIQELEDENAKLREAIKIEQDLRKNWHNEEAARLRHALAAVVRYAGNMGDDYLADKARQALAVNESSQDQIREGK